MSFKAALRTSVAIASFWLAFGAIFVPQAQASLAERINRTALDTGLPGNLVVDKNKVVLYGVRTDGDDTNGGKWACAKVVTVVLRKAGADVKVVTGVASVESALRRWKKITSERDVLPGDVVVWTSRLKGDGRTCTGSGTCHVGIKTTSGYFHNNPLGRSPTFGGAGLWMYKFKVAYRPAN